VKSTVREMSKNAYAPGGKLYEKRKAQNKRRGGPRRTAEGEDNWRKNKSDEESDENDTEESSEEESNEGEKVQPTPAIDIDNPNRSKPEHVKVADLETSMAKTDLSRREREEVEKQEAQQRYWEMHKAGKTDQAKADLARLALIRKQREDAAKKREEEKKAKEDAKARKK